MDELRARSDPDQPQTGEVHVAVWPDIPQVEIWTTCGKSFVVRGEPAREFARLMREKLCDPLAQPLEPVEHEGRGAYGVVLGLGHVAG